MENFFNYISKPIKPEDVDVWFKMNNVFPEKLLLYYDFSQSLYLVITETYLGYTNVSDTKIKLTDDDNQKHFKWCWNKILENFKLENIKFNVDGEHYDYFFAFFDDIYYNQTEEKIRDSIGSFFDDLFNTKKTFTKSDLDMLLTIYRLLDKNLVL